MKQDKTNQYEMQSIPEARNWEPLRTTTLCHVKAFTLIELLVVVLIIGILAAIAVPQYQKAVDKAKLQEALIQGRSLLEAQQLYVAANGKMALDLEELDIQVPGWSCGESGFCSKTAIAGVAFEVNKYFGDSHLSLMCRANISKNYNQQLCESLGATYSHKNKTFMYYILLKK